MILQALNEYYQRKAMDSSDLAPPGFESKAIDFIIVLDREGKPITIEDTREIDGKKRIGKKFLVPHSVKKSNNIAANFLWDNPEYALGVVQKGKPDRVILQHEAFISRIHDQMGNMNDSGVQAVLSFIKGFDTAWVSHFPAWSELAVSTGNVSFRLQGDTELVCQRSAVLHILNHSSTTDADTGFCLIRGETDITERVHPRINGVSQSSGANIVSFNLDAFCSWNKEQGYNSPIGKQAAFAYTTALNYLLRTGSRQRLQVGDTSTVFWAGHSTSFEEDLSAFLGEPSKDDPDRNTAKIRALYETVRGGGFTKEDDQNPFFLLGLAPNVGRIAIRFWHVGTVTEIGQRIVKHFDDLAIDHGPNEPEYPSLFRLMVHTAQQGKADNIPPNLGGEFMRAILEGKPYPYSLLQAAVRRNRAEHEVDYFRAAIVKGCLNRLQRIQPFVEKEITVSLDVKNPNLGYRLGRLFAVLEKIQQEAQPGINATIRDRFYGAASASPLAVFNTLMKLKNHHLSKLDNPRFVTYYERLIGEIIDGIAAYPAQLPLREQGMFSIGYYHQRQDFYHKKAPAP
ncbi:CRISPR-associated protein Csd1 [Gammaproteobacteria bacterium]